MQRTQKDAAGKPAGISADLLKVIALVTMAIDHTGAVLFPQQSGWRMLGRIAFPLFAWLLVEGFLHTSNRRRYIGSMAVFALLSELPFDLALAGRATFAWQNIYFTLLLCLLVLTALEKLTVPEMAGKAMQGVGYRYRRAAAVLLVAAAMAAAQWLHLDYGCSGPALVVAFYLYARSGSPALELGFILFCLSYLWKPVLRGQPIGQTEVWKSALANMELEFCGILAIPLLRQYNGVRRWKRGKYFFYFFYPVHLLVLYAVRSYMM